MKLFMTLLVTWRWQHINSQTNWVNTRKKMPKYSCVEHLIQYESTNLHYWIESSQQWNLGTPHHPRDKDRLHNIETHHLTSFKKKKSSDEPTMCTKLWPWSSRMTKAFCGWIFSPQVRQPMLLIITTHYTHWEKLFEERYQNSSTLMLPSSITVQHPIQSRQPNTDSSGKDGKCCMIQHTVQTWYPMILFILGFSKSLWTNIRWRVTIIILLQRWSTNYMHFIQIS